eukprot:sb/3478259/
MQAARIVSLTPLFYFKISERGCQSIGPGGWPYSHFSQIRSSRELWSEHFNWPDRSEGTLTLCDGSVDQCDKVPAVVVTHPPDPVLMLKTTGRSDTGSSPPDR